MCSWYARPHKLNVFWKLRTKPFSSTTWTGRATKWALAILNGKINLSSCSLVFLTSYNSVKSQRRWSKFSWDIQLTVLNTVLQFFLIFLSIWKWQCRTSVKVREFHKTHVTDWNCLQWKVLELKESLNCQPPLPPRRPECTVTKFFQ